MFNVFKVWFMQNYTKKKKLSAALMVMNEAIRSFQSYFDAFRWQDDRK